MSDPDAPSPAEANRATYRQGFGIGVFLGIGLVVIGAAYMMGAFDRPPPENYAYPCGDEIVDIDTDPHNCGGCGIVCPSDMPVCNWGSCECAEHAETCDDGCAEIDSDPRNCGGCGIVCPFGVACVDSVCACPAGRTACQDQHDEESDFPRILCVDTLTDHENCGECGSFCSVEHGGGCHEGVCDCGTWTMCAFGSNEPSCVNTEIDSLHCGECNHYCPNGPCVAGECQE